MTWLQKHHKQRATFWARSGADNFGDPSFAAAKSVRVRWENRSVVFTNAAGEEALSDSVVFVGEDMEPGDFLLLGVSSVADPTTVTGAREIQGWSKLPQLTGPDFERRAFLGARSR